MSWLVLPLALLLLWREWSLNRGQSGMIRHHARSRILYDLLSLAALALLLQPATTAQRDRVERQLTLVVVVDVSPSMGLTNGRLSRLDLARQEISALLDNLPGARLALIPFAGDAVLQVPLTSDHQALRFFLQSLQAGQVGAPGSAPEEALALAQKVLAGIRGEKAILLFSDGERTLPAPPPELAHDIPVYAVLPGDPQPRPVPGRTVAGAPARSTPDLARLQTLAEESGGRLLAHKTGSLAVAGLLHLWGRDASGIPGGQVDKVLLLAMLLLFLRQFSWLTNRRQGLALLLLTMLIGCRQSSPEKNGRQLFEQAMQQPDAVIAARTFGHAAELLGGEEKAASLHNACGKQLAARNYQAAVSACEKALFYAPGAADSAANLSLALRFLDQQGAGNGEDGRQQQAAKPDAGRGLSATEAREMVRQATIQPFAARDLAAETLKTHEIQVERDW